MFCPNLSQLPTYYTVRPTLVFHIVHRACSKEVEALCADVAPWEGPCPEFVNKVLPYDRCFINDCTINLFNANALSDDCKHRIKDVINWEYTFMLLDRGPSNLLEGMDYIQIHGNWVSLAFWMSPLPLLLMSICVILTLLSVYKLRIRVKCISKLRAKLLKAIDSDLQLKSLIERKLGGELFHTDDAFILKLVPNLNTMRANLKNRKMQTIAFRLVYSVPAIKEQAQAMVDEPLGNVPPLLDGDIAQLFTPTKKSNWRMTGWIEAGMVGAMFSHCQQDWMPPGVFLVIWLYIMIKKSIWRPFRHVFFAQPRVSKCCACGRVTVCNTSGSSSSSSSPPMKEECTLCSCTAVCNLECMKCMDRLNGKYTKLALGEE
mmetsp:Transcript_25398/g.42206  ORF Transcript_25398/g.42206 Transcript_25398/m.42206 type:complete len:374 (+) Transcript_25398:272-1393(+)